jgi:hypothetical protein
MFTQPLRCLFILLLATGCSSASSNDDSSSFDNETIQSKGCSAEGSARTGEKPIKNRLSRNVCMSHPNDLFVSFWLNATAPH